MWRISRLLPVLFLYGNAHAWIRMPVEDAVLVDRSKLIVVGRIKKGSVTYHAQMKQNHQGASWEYHAILVIVEVLKGKAQEKEIPITVNYGIDVVIGGKSLSNIRYHFGVKPTEDQIALYDHGNSAKSDTPFINHAEEEKLWFLCHRGGEYGREIGDGERLGIADPQEVQLIDLKDYFKTYLEADPESAVKKHVAGRPTLARRTERYFTHLEVQRILTIQDVEERAKKLIPYFLKGQFWPPKGAEARAGLIACGDVAGALLLKTIDDPLYADKRQEIIAFWGAIIYTTAADRLIDILKENNKFWDEQALMGNVWNTEVDAELARKRRQVYGETLYILIALRKIKDSRAKETVELTAKRCRAMKFPDSQILDECDRALREL